MGAPDVEGLPWPEGEPGALTGAAGKLTGIAGRLSAAGAPLGRAAGLGGWSGGASLASSMLLASQVQSVQGAAEVFGSTAAALRGLARLLSDGQDRIRALAREVKAAREAAQHARSLADAAGRRMAAQPDSPGLESAFLHLSAAAGWSSGTAGGSSTCPTARTAAAPARQSTSPSWSGTASAT
jgi:hypothetical protein